MKTAGYTACYNAIMGAKLPKPVKYQPFTVYFDRDKLDEIRDYYGAELYKECLREATGQIEKPNTSRLAAMQGGFLLRACPDTTNRF